MDISLVILTCNQRELTLRCIRSVYGLLERPEREIILVDNGSTDGTSESVKAEFPAISILKLDKNYGVAGGRNRGLSLARGRRLMILDNDTVASPDTIETLSEYLDKHPDVGLVAPRLVSPQGDVQSSFRPYPGIFSKLSNIIAGKRKSSIARSMPAAPVEPFYVIGAAQMFDAEIYRSSGGLDENIFYGPEDADFCMSVRAAGKKVVYIPTLSIVHDWQRATTSSLLSRGARVHTRALLYFYRKHHRFFW